MKKLLSQLNDANQRHSLRAFRLLFLASAILFTPLWVMGQQQTVSGQITDDTGVPLPGANVLIKGTTTGTVSDFDGKYTLNATSEDILIYSSVGFLSQERIVGAKSVIDLVLAPDIQQLEELVVTGYTIERKKDLLGAVAVVDLKAINDFNNPNVMQSLAGRVAGVNVSLAGEPGQGAIVNIRGISTLGNNSPLYIVDGVPIQPFTTNENGAANLEWGLAWLNPNDIESIQVLKDASSSSIYGSRASNGVVIITTKQPTQGAAIVGVNVRYGVESWVTQERLLNNRERAMVEWQGAVNDGSDPDATGVYTYQWHLDPSLGPGIQGDGVPVLDDIIYPDWLDEADQLRPSGHPQSIYGGDIEVGTDWFDQVAQTGIVRNYDVFFSQGGERGGVNLSLNFFDQTGVVVETSYQRFGLRLNSNYKFINNRLTIGQNLSVTRGERQWMDTGFGGTPEQGAFRVKSILPVRTEDGRFAGPPGAGFSDRDNPLALANDNREDRIHNTKLIGNIYANFQIMEGFNFNTSLGVDYDNIFTKDMFKTYQRGFLANTVAELDQRQSHFVNWVFNNTLTYTKLIGQHNITALVGTEAIEGFNTIMSARGKDFAIETNDGFQLDAAQGERNSGGSSTGFSLFSYFGKVNYTYKDKFLTSFTIRRDGSSRFGSENQFAWFPAASVGWRIVQEDFMSNVNWLSDLKIRAGWGKTGNQNIENEARFSLYRAVYAPDSYILPWDENCVQAVCPENATAYDIGNNDSGILSSGFVNTQTGNSSLKWESTQELNVGIDFGLFDQKLYGSFEVFKKKTEDILVQPTQIAAFGDGATVWVNGATMETNGWEAIVGYEGQAGDWSFNVSTNLSHYKDKITELPEVLFPTFPGNAEQNVIGHSPQVFFGYRTSGIFQDQGEVDVHADQTGKRVGALRFVDLNGDGVISALDQEYSKYADGRPEVQLGLSPRVTWKNFDLSMFFWATFGRKIAVNVSRAEQASLINGENGLVNTLDAWSPTNTGSYIPAMSNSLTNFGFSQDYNIRNGDFLAFRQLTIGYTLPQSVIENSFLSNLRVYLTGENLFWIVDTSGSDQYPFAEWRIEQQPGLFQTSYPKPQRFSLGVNIGF